MLSSRSRWIAIAFLCAAFALPIAAQTPTVVSATIADPNGVPYSFAKISAQLLPTTATPTVIANGIPTQIGGQRNATADANGSFSMNLFCNTAGGGCSVISPSGTQWQVTVQTNGVAMPQGTGPQSLVQLFTITGATQTLTFTGVPALTVGGAGGGGITWLTVATLPVSPALNTTDGVTDGNGFSCTVGGGSTKVLCHWNGASWDVINQGSGAAPAFSAVTPGTNAGALVMGTGGSLSTSGTGTIAATSAPYSGLTGVPSALVRTDQANTYSAFLQDFTAGTLKVPNGAGLAPTVTGLFAFDTTNGRPNFGFGGSNFLMPWFVPGTPNNAQCVTWSGTLGLMSSLGCLTNPMTTLGDTLYGGASGTATRLAGPTAPNGVPQFLCDTPAAGAAVAEAWCLAGNPIRANAAGTDTIAVTDRSSLVTENFATAVAVTGPALTSNISFGLFNLGAGLVTYTPVSGLVNGAANQGIPTNWFALHYTDGSLTRMPVMPSIAAFPSCSTGTSALTFTTATGAFGCNSISGGTPALNQVTSLTASNTPLVNGNFTETMGWQLTGSGVEDGWLFNETAASTNSGAGSALIHAKTLSGSTIIPLVVETANNFGAPFIFQVKMNATGVFGIDGNGGVQIGAAANNGIISCNAGGGQFCRIATGNAVDWSFFTNGVFAMGIPSGTGAQGSYIQIPNNGATATVVNKLAIQTGAPATATLALTTSTTGVVGLVVGGAGTTGSANILSHHGDMGNCVFDATAITADDYVVASTTVGGSCHDAGATRPATLQIIGRAMATAAASATVQVKLILDGE